MISNSMWFNKKKKKKILTYNPQRFPGGDTPRAAR
jgi:hypothetical protein